MIVDGDGTIDPLNKSTWNGEDLNKLELGIWNYVDPRSSHQQLAEKQNVNEARRSAQCKNHCVFSRDFNTETTNILCKKHK